MSRLINHPDELFFKMLGHVYTIENNLKNINTYKAFLQNPALLDSWLFQLEQIGELVGKVPIDIREKYDYIDFRSIYSLRNIVVHDYVGVDYNEIFSILKEDIPELGKSLFEILENDYDYDKKKIEMFQKEYNDTRKFNFDIIKNNY